MNIINFFDYNKKSDEEFYWKLFQNDYKKWFNIITLLSLSGTGEIRHMLFPLNDKEGNPIKIIIKTHKENEFITVSDNRQIILGMEKYGINFDNDLYTGFLNDLIKKCHIKRKDKELYITKKNGRKPTVLTVG